MDPVLIFRKLLQNHNAMIGIRGTCAMGLPDGRDVLNHAQGAWNTAVAMRWGSSRTGELFGALLRRGLKTKTTSSHEVKIHLMLCAAIRTNILNIKSFSTIGNGKYINAKHVIDINCASIPINFVIQIRLQPKQCREI